MAAAAAGAGGGQQEWVQAFEAERHGALRGAAGHLTPALVIAELKRAQEAEQQLAAQLRALQARAAGLQASAAATQAENMQLRQQLLVAKQAAEPSVVQLRQLLLDPAVNREFMTLKSELEARTRELAAAKLELSALRFGGGGSDRLVERIERQQDEIADLRRQLSEGRVAQLERSLAAAREQLDDVRRAQAEYEQHAFHLDQQAERLAEQLLIRRGGPPGPRQQQQAATQPGPRPPAHRP